MKCQSSAVLDVYCYADIFWLVFAFIILRLIFQLIWVYSLSEPVNLAPFLVRRRRGTDPLLVAFYSWVNEDKQRQVIYTVVSEALIGFLIALLYLWWQQHDSARKILGAGQALVLQHGIIRNAIGLVISAVVLVIVVWRFRNDNNGPSVIIRNRRRATVVV